MNVKKTVVICMCVITVAFSIGGFFTIDRTYSESENRHLSKWPDNFRESIFTGEYTRGIEAFLCDHFPMRDNMMELYTIAKRSQGFREINGVYLAKDGYLIEKEKKYESLGKFADLVSDLRRNYGDKYGVRVSLLPAYTSVTINEDKLPNNVKSRYQRDAMAYLKKNVDGKVNIVDTLKLFKEKNAEEQLYYKTDHHWTTYGAYYAYASYMTSLGIRPNDIKEYRVTKLADDFYGTVYSKVNDPSIKGDKMFAFTKDNSLTISYDGKTSKSLYNESYLKKRDKYSYFLNNINEKVIIENDKAKDAAKGKTLLVFKDSYANCMIPFLTDHFERIIVLDTRYYMYGCKDLIKKYNVNDILVLYNLATLDTDTGVNGIY